MASSYLPPSNLAHVYQIREGFSQISPKTEEASFPNTLGKFLLMSVFGPNWLRPVSPELITSNRGGISMIRMETTWLGCNGFWKINYNIHPTIIFFSSISNLLRTSRKPSLKN